MSRNPDRVTDPIARENRERGLISLYRKTHPGSPYPQIHYNIERFKLDSTEEREVKILNWKRLPSYGEQAPPPSHLRIVKELPPYGRETVPPLTVPDLLKENAELQEEIRKRDRLIEELIKRVEKLEAKIEVRR